MPTPKTATKTTRIPRRYGRGGRPNKSAFIRRFPIGTPNQTIIDEAAKLGMTVTVNLIGTVRHTLKEQVGVPIKRRPRKAKPTPVVQTIPPLAPYETDDDVAPASPDPLAEVRVTLSRCMEDLRTLTHDIETKLRWITR